MNRILLAVAVTASAFVMPAAAVRAQQQTPVKVPQGLHRMLTRHTRPEVQAMLQNQVRLAQSSTAQKPTADERLVAFAYTEAGGDYYDSTRYQYSGTRGSNLTTSLFSYFDYYFPLNTLNPGLYEQITPTLRYDTLTDYFQSAGSALMVDYQATHAYDAANKVTGVTQRSFDGSGILTYQAYATVAYNAGSDEIDEANNYSDTSIALSGQYALTSRLGTEYNAGLRVKDTSLYIFGIDYNIQAHAYTYDGSGRLIMTMTQYFDSFSGMWEDVSRSSYTYDAPGRLLKSVYEVFNGATWMVNTLDTFGYTGSSPNYTFYEESDYGSPDMTVSRSTAVLNSLGAWDSVYYYNVEGGVPQLTEAYKLSYNGNNHLTNYTGYNDAGVFSAEARFYYEPTGATGVADVRKAGAAFATIFPNPAGNTATVSIANPQGRVSIAVTNMAGQVLYQQSSAAGAGMALHTASLPAGNYQVSITMNGAVQTLKLVKR